MPGMMDTVLNLGLNDRTVRGPRRDARSTRASPTTAIAASSRCTATSCWASTVPVRGSARGPEAAGRLPARHRARHRRPAAPDRRPTRRSSRSRPAAPFPQDPQEQLWGAIGAVFGSWMTPRAVTYRRLNDIPEAMGTAVNVQAMVFGNLGDDSRHRRRLHARSVDRREGASTASSCSTPRARTSSPASARRSRSLGRQLATGADCPRWKR